MSPSTYPTRRQHDRRRNPRLLLVDRQQDVGGALDILDGQVLIEGLGPTNSIINELFERFIVVRAPGKRVFSKIAGLDFRPRRPSFSTMFLSPTDVMSPRRMLSYQMLLPNS